jgi:2-polyprenyl-3-methyl-5-hydroxy-6-metoxy-1,4-benzoquinol methylase
MLTVNSDRAWEKYGDLDPYYGVLTDEKFRTSRLDGAARAEFFRSGEEHMQLMMDIIHRRLAPGFRPRRALDFGCGVGRLTIPLARICDEVVGVDVAEGMLREAGRNCAVAGVTNVKLARSDDRLSQLTGSFDFLHSYIVFQHIPPRRGMSLLRSMLERLRPDGAGALHFTYARRASPARKAIHWLRKTVPLVNGMVNLCQGRAFTYPMMQMNAYDLDPIAALLDEHGCRDAFLRFTTDGGFLGAIVFFHKSSD